MARERTETRSARTLLEQRIWQLNQTQEEFAAYATNYARVHHEPATISARHLQRLVAGRNADGALIGVPRPTTARLLELIFDILIGELLAPIPGDAASDAYRLSVAVAVVRKGVDVLLVSPRDDDSTGLKWQFPAGIVKPGRSPETVAVRETLAETNVRCMVSRKLGSRVHPVTSVLCIYFLCNYVAGDIGNVDRDENSDVTWVSTDRVTHMETYGVE